MTEQTYELLPHYDHCKSSDHVLWKYRNIVVDENKNFDNDNTMVRLQTQSHDLYEELIVEVVRQLFPQLQKPLEHRIEDLKGLYHCRVVIQSRSEKRSTLSCGL